MNSWEFYRSDCSSRYPSSDVLTSHSRSSVICTSIPAGPRVDRYRQRSQFLGPKSAIDLDCRRFSRTPIRSFGTGSSSIQHKESQRRTFIFRAIGLALIFRNRNVEINTTFTSSSSEHAFFLLSLLCELHAPPILRSMASTLDESFFSDALALPRIASHLTLIANLIDQLTDLLAQAMKGSFGVNGQSNIIPEVFYWDIRPWFNGGKWRYEGVDAVGREAEWGGPSAGQSSLIHAVDLFLGIDHSPRPSATPSPPTITPPSLSIPTATPALPSTPQKILPKPALSSSFMEKASLYMPSHHRAFLHHLSSLSLFSPRTNPHPLPSIRSLAIKHPKDVGIAFDDAVRSMKRFRDEHMKIATRFIVSQARKEPDRSSVFWVEWEEKRMAKELLTTSPPVSPIGSSSDGEEGGEGKLKGTGGTELVTFLKGCRVRTIEALVGSPSSS